MIDFERLKLIRNGDVHVFGPVSLLFEGIDEHGPRGVCKVRTATEKFSVSWLDGEAIAFCLLPTEDLWLAYESDKEVQLGSGEERGWLHLRITAEKDRLGAATAWADKAFQVSRLIMDAQAGEVVKRADGAERSTDYSRPCFIKQGGAARSVTRTSFIHACTVLARGRHPSLSADWEREAWARWRAADDAADFARNAGRDPDVTP